MTRTEHLITILGEEGVEVAQRCSKATRFGLEEVQAGQGLNNAERILQEYADLLAVMEMLQEEGLIPNKPELVRSMIDAKKVKVEQFLAYSQACGRVDAPKL